MQGMPEFLRKFLWPIGVAIFGIFNVFGGNVVTDLLGKIWPDGANWIKANLIVYALLWGLVVLNSFLYKSNHNRGVELKGLRGNDHDLSMSDAIEYIQKKERVWRHSSPEIIWKAITVLAYERKLVVWGRPRDLHLEMVPPPDTLIEVPYHFFYDALGGLHEDRGFMFTKFSELPGAGERTTFSCISDVRFSRGQVRARFSKLKPNRQ